MFIRKIGTNGKGPNEYNGIRELVIDEKRELVYILSNGDMGLVCYNFDGKPVQHFTFFNEEQFSNFEVIDSITYVGYIPNAFGNETKRLIIDNFHKNKQVIIPNYTFFEQEPMPGGRLFMLMLNVIVQFYHFEDKLHFKECLNDTVFTIENMQILPKYTLNLQNLTLPVSFRGKSLRELIELQNRYIIIKTINESPAHLLISADYNNKIYSIVFDKTTGKTVVVDIIDKTPLPFYGLQNDISSMNIPFWPRYTSSSGEMVTWYDAFDFLEYCKENKIDALPNLLEEDNPVIVIVN